MHDWILVEDFAEVQRLTRFKLENKIEKGNACPFITLLYSEDKICHSTKII
jgi:hypothetical protein